MKRIGMVAYTELRYDARVKRAITAALKAGFQVDIFTLKEEKPSEITGVQIFTWAKYQYDGSNKFRFIMNYLRFFWFILFKVSIEHLKKRYHILHVHNMPNFLVFGCIIPKLLGAKLILDVHDLVPEVYASKFNRPLNDFLIKLLYWEERYSAKFSDLLISTNKFHNQRFNQNKITGDFPIILNAPDEDVFRPYENHNFYEMPLKLIFPSTIAKRLGIEVLIEAIGLVVQELEEIKLFVFGDGEYMEDMIKLIKEKNLDDHVEYTNWVDHEKLSLEYEKAHIGLIPWPNNESTKYQMPVKLNEYFAKGLAAIVSDVEILKEYFSGHAVFFEAGNPRDLADKILELARHRDELERWAHKGREFYLKHRWPVYRSRYQNILNSLLESNKN